MDGICSDVHHNDCVDVDEDRFVTDYHFATVLGAVVNEHFNVANIELILKLNEELVLMNILFSKSEHVESKRAALSIAENIELSCLTLKLDILAESDSKEVIDVYLLVYSLFQHLPL